MMWNHMLMIYQKKGFVFKLTKLIEKKKKKQQKTTKQVIDQNHESLFNFF